MKLCQDRRLARGRSLPNYLLIGYTWVDNNDDDDADYRLHRVIISQLLVDRITVDNGDDEDHRLQITEGTH